MRTIVFSFLFFLTCALSGFAQDFRWGVVGGLNYIKRRDIYVSVGDYF